MLKVEDIYNQIESINGWFSKEDVEIMSTLDLPQKPIILELGTHQGRSTKAMRLLWPKADITTVDNQVRPTERFVKEMKITFLFGGAGYAIPWKRKIDLLFVDDDHIYETVVEDIKRFKKWVKKGGYILFHDYYGEGVFRAVNELIGESNITAHHTGDNSMAVWRKK